MLRVVINSSWKCGCHISKIDNNYYEISFWLDTKELEYLDTDVISNENQFIYEEATKLITNNLVKKGLLLAAMGIGMFVKYENDIISMIQKSKGVNRWVIPKAVEPTIKISAKNTDKFYFF